MSCRRRVASVGFRLLSETPQDGQKALWDEIEVRVITGKLAETSRLENVPVRLPLPPAPDAGSIFKTQKAGGAKSAFAAEQIANSVHIPRMQASSIKGVRRLLLAPSELFEVASDVSALGRETA